MQIEVRDGKTVNGYRPYTSKAALAHFLASIPTGESMDISAFTKVDGSKLTMQKVQIMISATKSEGDKFASRIVDGKLRIWRVA